MSDISDKCPNCAWAIRVAEERQLGMAEGWLLVHIAEWVDRRTFQWDSTITELARRVRLSRRGVQKALKRIPHDLLSMKLEGGHYTFSIHRSANDVHIPPVNEVPVEAVCPVNEVHTAANEVHIQCELGSHLYIDTPKSPLSTPKTPPLPPKNGGRRAARAVRVAEGWDEFWSIYPRKDGKGDAFKAYVQAIKAAGDYNDVLDLLAEEMDSGKFKPPVSEGTDYRPYPATWLRAGPWHAPDWKPKPSIFGDLFVETGHAD